VRRRVNFPPELELVTLSSLQAPSARMAAKTGTINLELCMVLPLIQETAKRRDGDADGLAKKSH
jgi:hypothetical protein